MASHAVTNPVSTWVVPCLAMILALLGMTILEIAANGLGIAVASVSLIATVFVAVHHAEILALKLGDPFGSILLAVAVTIIEVALIISLMVARAPGSESVARDTIFSAVMIVLNGVVGFCLVLGGRRHFEQEFQAQGAASALAVLGTLAGITLILPNFTTSIPGPYLSTAQILVVGLLSLVLWSVFVFVQTVKHRNYFVETATAAIASDDDGTAAPSPTNTTALASLFLLLLALGAVVLLAKTLSYPLEKAIVSAGIPKIFVGVVIASIVLLPEGFAAVKSALRNQMQNSINLSLGSAIASIGLTVPTVAVASLVLEQDLVLGVGPTGITLLLLTLFVSTLTLGTGRTTVLQGAIHLVIFGAFLLVSAVP